MLKFLNGHLMGTTSSAGAAAGAEGAAGGSGGGASNDNFLASLAEPLRANAAFKDVKDVNDLATRYADLNKPFAERLPEAIRGEAYFKDIKSYEDLATRAFNQAKMIGKDPNSLISLPTDPKDAAGIKAVFAKLGTPETVEKYQLPTMKADGKAYSPEDQAFQKQILPILHEANLTQGQLAAILPKWDGLMEAMNKASGDASAAEFKKSEDALRAEWGGAYDQNVDQANRAIAHYSAELKLGDALEKELNRANLGNNPALAKIFARLGAQLKEDGLIGKEAGASHGDALTPAQVKQQIAALQANPAWRDKTHAEHNSVLEQISALYAQAYPETT